MTHSIFIKIMFYLEKMDTKFLMSLLSQVNKNQEYIHKGFKKTISVWVSHNRYQKSHNLFLL